MPQGFKKKPAAPRACAPSVLRDQRPKHTPKPPCIKPQQTGKNEILPRLCRVHHPGWPSRFGDKKKDSRSRPKRSGRYNPIEGAATWTDQNPSILPTGAHNSAVAAALSPKTLHTPGPLMNCAVIFSPRRCPWPSLLPTARPWGWAKCGQSVAGGRPARHRWGRSG